MKSGCGHRDRDRSDGRHRAGELGEGHPCLAPDDEVREVRRGQQHRSEVRCEHRAEGEWRRALSGGLADGDRERREEHRRRIEVQRDRDEHTRAERREQQRAGPMREPGRVLGDPRQQPAALRSRGDQQHRLEEDDDHEPVAKRLVFGTWARDERGDDGERDCDDRERPALRDHSEDRRGERGEGERFAQRTTPGALVGSRRPPSRARSRSVRR